ncbi:MAG: hypothetical protein M1406_00510 [Nitrospirae bacterium]|nr:hypothetical protein [Nitrospirota bacterium]
MKLPNSKNAYISSSKLLDYLLSQTHPIGKTKARYLRSAGFNESNVNLLRQSLVNLSQTEEIKEVITSPHGVKYLIEGSIQTPTGTYIKLRTIWIIDSGQDYPRFVTAYPL